MKTFLILFLLGQILFSQEFTDLFDPNSSYLERGLNQAALYSSEDKDIDRSFNAFKKLNWRTVAVNPQKILPGSVVFIPELAGVKISGRLYHDGYFFAHQVLNDRNAAKVKIYVDLETRIDRNP